MHAHAELVGLKSGLSSSSWRVKELNEDEDDASRMAHELIVSPKKQMRAEAASPLQALPCATPEPPHSTRAPPPRPPQRHRAPLPSLLHSRRTTHVAARSVAQVEAYTPPLRQRLPRAVLWRGAQRPHPRGGGGGARPLPPLHAPRHRPLARRRPRVPQRLRARHPVRRPGMCTCTHVHVHCACCTCTCTCTCCTRACASS